MRSSHMLFPGLALLVVAACTSAGADGGRVFTGVVRDADVDRPIPRAQVYLGSGSVGTVADDSGRFELVDSAAAPSLALHLRALGYHGMAVRVESDATGRILVQGAELVPRTSSLEPMRVLECTGETEARAPHGEANLQRTVLSIECSGEPATR